MRPKGTKEQLAARRKRGLELLAQRQSTADVAVAVGVTARTARRWCQDADAPRSNQKRRLPGRPSKLTARQLWRLEKALLRGAYAHGYAEDYWTLDRIAHVVWELFGVRYHRSSIWHILRGMDWSSQKPQRQPFQRDDEAIAHWQPFVWPQIKKVAPTGSDADF